MKARRTFIKATVLSAALASILASFSALAADARSRSACCTQLSSTMAISETALKERTDHQGKSTRPAA